VICTNLLDSNIFIEAKNYYYGFKTFPGFWKWLDVEQAQGRLGSIQPICSELLKGDDELSAWAKDRKDSGWFVPVDDEQTQLNLTKIANWVMEQPYKEAAKTDFLSGGDPWLIAKAMTLEATVVTLETFDALTKKKVKIPNVCHTFGITYMDTFELLGTMGATFALQEKKS